MAQSAFKPERQMWSKKFTYDYWMESSGVPIHKGFFVDDLRTVELGWWDERQCLSAFIQLMGSEGVSSSRITEIAAGETTRPLKFALDEVVYVVSGRGLSTIWYDNSSTKKSFEWQQHSMFLLPMAVITPSSTCRATGPCDCFTTATCHWHCQPFPNPTTSLITRTTLWMICRN